MVRTPGQGSARLRSAAWALPACAAACASPSPAATNLEPLPHTPDKVYPADAVVNVTLPPYSATPDDNKDDTAALQKAITDNVDTGRVLYFPNGTYNISDSLVARNKDGLWRAHLTLQGRRREKVILKLADGAADFGDSKHPKAMLVTGSHWEPGDAADGGGNKAFRNNVFDMTFDSGKRNAGAVGIDWAVSNIGSLENVTVQSGDGTGSAGIAVRRRIPGPGFIKNVSVSGFDVGIDVADIQYGITLENVNVSGQKIAGVRNGKNQLHVRRLVSHNSVPGVLVTAREGVLTLLDSRFDGPLERAAIVCHGTSRVRNCLFQLGPKKELGQKNYYLSGEWIDQGRESRSGFSDSPSEANFLVRSLDPGETDTARLDELEAVGARRDGEPDDTAAIQRAIDAGKPVVYFPTNRTYFLSDTVIVRGKVRQILGMGSEISLGAAQAPFSDIANPRPLFRLDPTDGPDLSIENVFFNAQYPGEVIFENNTPKTVVIRHCGGWVGADGHRRSYRNTAQATGEVFLEDNFLPGWSFKNQTVYVRQLNPENWDGDGSEPQVLNDGGKLWILGFKTEGAAPFISTINGGTTELLGAYNYVSATKTLPENSVPYVVTDSTASLTFTTDNFGDKDYATYIRETRDGVVQNWARKDLPPRNGIPGDRSLAVPLWQSGAAK